MNSVQSFDPSAVRITVTSKAAQHINKHLLNSKESVGLLLSTRLAGCSGLTYVTEILTSLKPGAIKAEVNEDLPIYIDKAALTHLNGLTVDLEAKALGQYNLVFINPNATGECGCKESFSVNSGSKLT